MFIYDLGINETIVRIAILSSLAFITIGILLFVISMQIFLIGEKILEKRSIKILAIITLVIVLLNILMTGNVEVTSLDPVTTKKNIPANLLIVFWNYFLMGYNIKKFREAIKSMEEDGSQIKERIQNIYTGQVLALFCPMWSVIGNIMNDFNPDIAVYLTSMIYVFLALVMIKTWTTLKKQE